MAYDNNGNYYFEPNTDSDDAEALGQLDKMTHAAQYRKGQANQQAYNEFMNRSWHAALKEEGLSPREYDQLFGQDPKAGAAAVKEGMKLAARSVKTRKAAGPSGGREIPVDKARAMAHAKDKIQGGQQLSDDKLLDLLEF